VPTYQYACTACGHQLEAVQSFSDAALTQCPECEGRLRKLFSSVGVVFKGSGFYRTDSRNGNGKADAAKGSTDSKTASSNGSSTGSGGSSDGAKASSSGSASSGSSSSGSSSGSSSSSGSASGSSGSSGSSSTARSAA
jgi:putative FmdB family regulatory protein